MTDEGLDEDEIEAGSILTCVLPDCYLPPISLNLTLRGWL